MFGYTNTEALIVGAALMFSSTIIGLKLIPTTVLHHQHTGEVIISILLLQDIIAIFLLLLLEGSASSSFGWYAMSKPLLAFPLLVAGLLPAGKISFVEPDQALRPHPGVHIFTRSGMVS